MVAGSDDSGPLARDRAGMHVFGIETAHSAPRGFAGGLADASAR
jgi:hypothetical protein